MNNCLIKITAEGKKTFSLAMEIFFNHRAKKTVAYQIDEDKGLILFWTKCDKGINLPYEMTLSQTIEFCWGWLENIEYPTQPYHDGDNKKGFCIYNEDYGHINNMWEAFAAIKPIWAMYGK
jgi:hypothetical protein